MASKPKKPGRPQSVVAPAIERPRPTHEGLDDDEAEIRYSLTALGELAVARADRRGRGPRFVGFGPCGAVA